MTATSPLPAPHVILIEQPSKVPGKRGMEGFWGMRYGNKTVLTAYLSPIDLLLDSMRGSAPNQAFKFPSLDRLPAARVKQTFPTGVELDIACGFLARDGQLLLSPSGKWRRNVLVHDVRAPLRMGILVPEYTTDGRRAISRLFEGAGLFAWQDTLQSLARIWKGDRMKHAIDSALATASTVVHSAGQVVNQIAVFDPEAEQWHFVPCQTMDDVPENNHPHGGGDSATVG
ncbi:hypothetical protein [Cupriavidus sp. GA3-3]|uniref:hypothetical protein n=1 Tax=Cupriavidus sp. GA3-3 TaxID=1229514 RepID=UPI0011821A9E|nr:hypothetical protein [Cupriavidus sp. GA3-3]